ncbi:MAG TPA: hypothetical protein VE033_03215, partial [Acetobacteraceae bacterium]|nr:hypothetical protein [Acetobacteraceae bacterium]
MSRRTGPGVLHPEDELDMRRRPDQPLRHQLGGVAEHGEVENLDPGLDALVAHGGGERTDEVRRVPVDDGRKVHAAGGQARHVGAQVQHGAAGLGRPAAAAGAELDGHVRAVPADAVLEGGELAGIAARRLVAVADMDVDERGAGLAGGVGALDLLGHADRQ